MAEGIDLLGARVETEAKPRSCSVSVTPSSKRHPARPPGAHRFDETFQMVTVLVGPLVKRGGLRLPLGYGELVRLPGRRRCFAASGVVV